MTGGSITRCGNCGRLIIYGQRCPCSPRPEVACDCTFDGNRQAIGPECQQRIDDSWRAAIATSWEIAQGEA